jgi:dynein assembly factor with WDR repeat domains 1
MNFNVPFGNKICTGSFDNTAKVWDSVTGKLLSTYTGHEG